MTQEGNLLGYFSDKKAKWGIRPFFFFFFFFFFGHESNNYKFWIRVTEYQVLNISTQVLITILLSIIHFSVNQTFTSVLKPKRNFLL